MRIAILIGVSKYNNLDQLPACENDLILMQELIIATKRFDEVFVISALTNYVDITNSLHALSDLQDENIDELLFYYSGHGHFDGNEFYFACSDSNPDDITGTYIKNSLLDLILKSLNPDVAVKIVDACNSGVLYIKGDETAQLDDFLDVVRGRYNSCYFMFSSANDQNSVADDNLSFFTRSFFEAINNHESPKIRYSDIINSIPEYFVSSVQKPKFIMQGDSDHVFCNIDSQVKDVVSKALSSSTKSSGNSVLRDNNEIYQLIQKVQNPKNSLASCIAEALKIAEIHDDEDLKEFCNKELTGWDEERVTKDDSFSYRLIEFTVSPIGDISRTWPGNVSGMFDFMESHPNKFGKVEIFQKAPISTYERAGDKNIEKEIIHRKMSSEKLLPGYDGSITTVHCYAKTDIYKIIVERVRKKLTEKLLKLL